MSQPCYRRLRFIDVAYVHWIRPNHKNAKALQFAGHHSPPHVDSKMDPLSMTASIGSVCVIAVKLISSLSDFIDNARSASAEVQSLTNELASLYSCLGHVKLAIQQPRHANGVSESWKKDLDKLLKDCIETLGLLQDVVAKAKVVETRASGQQLWKSIKFVFKTKTIEVLRRRIVLQNGVLTNLLSLLLE